MANDDLVITDDETTAGDLRKAYEKMKAKAEAAEKQASQLLAEKRTSTVADILKAKGAPAKAAKFYDGEADEASVVAWLKENEELFPISTPTTTDSTTTTAASPEAGATPQNDLNALAAQLLGNATATVGSDFDLPAGTAQGAPVTDLAAVQQMTELLRNTPRTREGYEQFVKMGLFPQNPDQV